MCVCVPTHAVTRPSRCQPIATFSLVASAWKSTSTCCASIPARIASTSANGERAVTMLNWPWTFTSASRAPSFSMTVWPRPGAALGKFAGRMMRSSRSSIS